jgi:hypothetical protein
MARSQCVHNPRLHAWLKRLAERAAISSGRDLERRDQPGTSASPSVSRRYESGRISMNSQPVT